MTVQPDTPNGPETSRHDSISLGSILTKSRGITKGKLRGEMGGQENV
jgi:hypothetical protein